jgi:hypothetical protein
MKVISKVKLNFVEMNIQLICKMKEEVKFSNFPSTYKKNNKVLVRMAGPNVAVEDFLPYHGKSE